MPGTGYSDTSSFADGRCQARGWRFGQTLVVTGALPHDDRPVDPTPVSTADLPATPMRDRRIPATAWTEAPDELLALAGQAAGLAGAPDGEPITSFLRRIGPWLLWRSGPAKGPAICWAVHADDLSLTHRIVLNADGSASGHGPSGEHHERFRTWKEDLRDHP